MKIQRNMLVSATAAALMVTGIAQAHAGTWVIHEEEDLTLAYREGGEEDGHDVFSVGCSSAGTFVMIPGAVGHAAPAQAPSLVYGESKIVLDPDICTKEEPCGEQAEGEVSAYTASVGGKATAIAIAGAKSIAFQAPGLDLALTMDDKVSKAYAARCKTYN